MERVRFSIISARADAALGAQLTRRLRRIRADGRRLRPDADPLRADWVICMLSPALVADTVRTEEVRVFAEQHGIDRVLLVHIGGDLVWNRDQEGWEAPSTAMPGTLGRFYSVEPRWADLTGLDDVGNLRSNVLDAAAADLAAPMLGVERRRLAGDEVRRHRRLLRTAMAVGAAAILLTGVSAVQLGRTQNREHAARALRDRSAAGLLAATADQLAFEQPVVSELLAAQAWRQQRTPEARAAVLAARDRSAVWGDVATLPGCRGQSAAARPDGVDVFLCDDGSLYTWSPGVRQPARLPFTVASADVVEFAADGSLWVLDYLGTVDHVDAGLTRIMDSWAFPTGAQVLVATADYRRVFAGREDGSVQVIDTRTGLLQVAVPDPVTGGSPIWNLAVAANGSRVAVLTEDGRLVVYDLATRTVRYRDDTFDEAVALTADGSRVLVGHDSGTISSVPLARPEDAVTVSTLHSAVLQSIQVGIDGVATSRDVAGWVMRWRVDSLEWLMSLGIPLEKAAVVVVDATGGHLAGLDLYGRVARDPMDAASHAVMYGAPGDARAVDLGAVRDGLIGVRTWQGLELWDTRKDPWARAAGTVTASLSGCWPRPHALVPVGGPWLVCLSYAHDLVLLDLRNGAAVSTVPMPDDAVMAKAPGGVVVVGAGQVHLVETSGGRLRDHLAPLLDPSGQPVTAEVGAVDAFSDGKGAPTGHVFVIFRNGNAWRLDARTGRPAGALIRTGTSGDQLAVTWSDGRRVLTASSTGALRLWDAATGAATGPWFSVSAGISDVAETDDHHVATATTKGLYVFDPGSGLPVLAGTRPDWMSDEIGTVRPIPGTGRVVLVGPTATYRYDLDGDRAVTEICAKVARDLTREEWARYTSGGSYRSTCSPV